MKQKNKKNVTKYGEFIPTFHAWLGLEEQKERAKELMNMTKKNKK